MARNIFFRRDEYRMPSALSVRLLRRDQRLEASLSTPLRVRTGPEIRWYIRQGHGAGSDPVGCRITAITIVRRRRETMPACVSSPVATVKTDRSSRTRTRCIVKATGDHRGHHRRDARREE